MEEVTPEMLDDERDELRAHAATYLVYAGFHRGPLDSPGCLAMERRGAQTSLVVRIYIQKRRVELDVTLRGKKTLARMFHGRSAYLQLFFQKSCDLLGFLCLLTSSHDDLSEDSAAEWMDALVQRCPETYAVLSEPGERVALAHVAVALPRVVH